MPRHRAPHAPSTVRLALSTIAVTGAAVSATALAPLSASAAGLGDHSVSKHNRDGDRDHSSSRHTGKHHYANRHQVRQVRQLRAPTSGEEQYRNGCRRGYISDECGLYSVHSMLRRGINPFL
jgi:hypothetical protein